MDRKSICVDHLELNSEYFRQKKKYRIEDVLAHPDFPALSIKSMKYAALPGYPLSCSQESDLAKLREIRSQLAARAKEFGLPLPRHRHLTTSVEILLYAVALARFGVSDRIEIEKCSKLALK